MALLNIACPLPTIGKLSQHAASPASVLHDYTGMFCSAIQMTLAPPASVGDGCVQLQPAQDHVLASV